MDKELAELRKQYILTIEKNLKSLKEIINDVGISDSVSVMQLKEMLDKSSRNLAEKWKSGRKSLRTEIACKVLPEYPSNVIQTSLTIDSIINILDDSLDELMTKHERTLYTIELVRNLAVFNQHMISSESRRKISEYFNKILCIGITEILYEEKIKASDDFSQRLHFSIQCYNCKCLVTDIFFELPLLELYGEDKRIEDIVSLARIHRALFQIKKDYKDLERDIKNQTETPIVVLSKHGSVESYIDAMIYHYEQESRKAELEGFDGDFQLITRKLHELISDEIAGYRTKTKNVLQI